LPLVHRINKKHSHIRCREEKILLLEEVKPNRFQILRVNAYRRDVDVHEIELFGSFFFLAQGSLGHAAFSNCVLRY
jgi:hypothetical protein